MDSSTNYSINMQRGSKLSCVLKTQTSNEVVLMMILKDENELKMLKMLLRVCNFHCILSTLSDKVFTRFLIQHDLTQIN